MPLLFLPLACDEGGDKHVGYHFARYNVTARYTVTFDLLSLLLESPLSSVY